MELRSKDLCDKNLVELFLPEHNPPAGEVVRGQLHFHAIAGQNSNEMLSHFAGDNTEDLAIGIIEPQLEHGIW